MADTPEPLKPPPISPPVPGSYLDLNKLSGALSLTVETENPQKLDADLKKDAHDAAFARWTKAIRDVGAFFFAIVCAGVLMNFAIVIIKDEHASVDDKKWATALLASIAASAAAFVMGKQAAK